MSHNIKATERNDELKLIEKEQIKVKHYIKHLEDYKVKINNKLIDYQQLLEMTQKHNAHDMGHYELKIDVIDELVKLSEKKIKRENQRKLIENKIKKLQKYQLELLAHKQKIEENCHKQQRQKLESET
ncbi:hypothetical protein [Spiroplasma endosymbiont of Dilophus febrilis]